MQETFLSGPFDISSVAPRVEALLANADPATQLSDMHAIAKLFAESDDAEKTAELTRTTLSHLSADDRRDLFAVFGKTLRGDQLVAVFRGFDAQTNLADRVELRKAILENGSDKTRLAFFVGLTPREAASVDPKNDARAMAGVKALAATREQFITDSAVPGEKREQTVYKAMRAPRVMTSDTSAGGGGQRVTLDPAKAITRPFFNEFHRQYGEGVRAVSTVEHVIQVVDDALNFAGAQARSAEFAMAEPDPTRVVNNLLLAIGEKAGKVTVLPVAYADKENGCTYTMLFSVEDSANETHIVDSRGRTYASLDDFRANNDLAPDGVNLVMPKNGKIELNAQKDVKLFTGDAHTEDSATKVIREYHLKEAAAVGGTVLGVASMFLTGGVALAAMAAGGAYSAATTASDIGEQRERGLDWKPWDSRQNFFQWAGLGLGAYGSAQTGVRLAGMAAAKVVDATSKTAVVLGKAEKLLHSRVPTVATAAGDLASAANGLYDFKNEWRYMDGAQKAQRGLDTVMQLAGLKYNVGVIRSGGKPQAPSAGRGSGAADPLLAPHPKKAPANANTNEFNPLVMPGANGTESSAATAANIRDAVWHRADKVPDDIRQAYEELHAKTPDAGALVKLEGREHQVFAFREKQPDGSQKIIGVSVVAMRAKGDRTLDIPDTNFKISLGRYIDGAKVLRGDSKLVSVVGDTGAGLSGATRAALVGMQKYTNRDRVIVNTTNPDVLAGAQAVKGTEVVLSRVTSDAKAAVAGAIDAGLVVQPRVRDAASIPNDGAAMSALATTDNLPAGARTHQIVHTIERKPDTLYKKIFWAAREGSYLYRFTDFTNPIRHITNGVLWAVNPVKRERTIASWQVRVDETTVHTFESKIYKKGKIPDHVVKQMAANHELADRDNAKLINLTDKQIEDRQKAFEREYLDKKDNAFVIFKRDASGGEGTVVVEGQATARYFGDKRNGTFAGEPVPDDALHVSLVSTAPGYESMYLDAFHTARTIAKNIFKASEINASTTNVHFRNALAASNAPIIKAGYTKDAAPVLFTKMAPEKRRHLPAPVAEMLARIEKLPANQQFEALQDALHVNNNRDFLLPWLEGRKLYTSLIADGAERGWNPLAARRIWTAIASDPAAVDRLPTAIRDAVVALNNTRPDRATVAARDSRTNALVRQSLELELQAALLKLPPPIRHPRAEAQLAKRAILEQGNTPDHVVRAEAAFRAAAERTDRNATPMLELPGGVVELHIRDPQNIDPSLLQKSWAKGWNTFRNAPGVRSLLETMGNLTGRPRFKKEIEFSDPALRDKYIAVLHPRSGLARKDYLQGAEALKDANRGHENNVFAQKTVQQLADELQDMYLVRLHRKNPDGTAGELLNTRALAVNYKGPDGINRWDGVDGVLPPNSVEDTHLFGKSDSPEIDLASYTAAKIAAQDKLLANHMVYDTRRKEAQAFFARLNIKPQHVAPSSHASDLLLGVGPLELKTLPEHYQEAIHASRSHSPLVSKQREFLDDFLKTQGEELFHDSQHLPDGVVDMAFTTDLQPTLSPGQNRTQAAGVVMSQTVKPWLRDVKAGIGALHHTINVYSGDKSIEPDVKRKFKQDIGYLGANGVALSWDAAKWGLAASAAYKLVSGEEQLQARVNNDQAMKTFNVVSGSKSLALHVHVGSIDYTIPFFNINLRNLGITVALWDSPAANRFPMWPKEWGGPGQPSQPMLKIAKSVTNPLATGKSATAMWLGRSNLGEIGFGVNVGNNDVGERFAVGLRGGSFQYNLRGEMPLQPNAGMGAGFLTAATLIQPFFGTTSNFGAFGVIKRINGWVQGLQGGLGKLAHKVDDSALALFAGRHLQVAGRKPSTSEGDFITFNMAHGEWQVWYRDEIPEGAEAVADAGRSDGIITRLNKFIVGASTMMGRPTQMEPAETTKAKETDAPPADQAAQATRTERAEQPPQPQQQGHAVQPVQPVPPGRPSQTSQGPQASQRTQPTEPAQPAQPVQPAPPVKHPVARGQSLWRIAKSIPHDDMTVLQTMATLYQENPHAFKNNNLNDLKQGVTLTLPPKEERKPIEAAEVRRLVNRSILDYARRQSAKVDPTPTPAAIDERKRKQERDDDTLHHMRLQPPRLLDPEFSPYSGSDDKFGIPQFQTWTSPPIGR